MPDKWMSPEQQAALKIASPLAVTRGLRNDIAAALLREWVNGAEAAGELQSYVERYCYGVLDNTLEQTAPRG